MLQILGLSRHISDQSTEPINALASTDSDRASAPVAVTNKAETASMTTAKVPAVIPRLFVQSNYVAAVRASDGTILSRGVAARPTEAIELYGTGFGPSTSSADGEVDSAGAGSTSNAVTVSIGGIRADVRFAGRVGPGLYQINVVVPADLPSGDHPVIVSIAEMSTPCEALLKVARPSEVSLNPEGRYSCFARKAMEETAGLSGTDFLVGSHS
jgi:uncharacterized protein (TIGR03437 family)